jgi:hypothetical protein
MLKDRLYIGAYWGTRKESAGECAQRAELFFQLWPEALRGQETLEVDPGPGMMLPSAESQWELRLLERGQDLTALNAFEARQSTLVSLPMANLEPLKLQDPLAHHRHVLAGRSLEDFLKDLRKSTGRIADVRRACRGQPDACPAPIEPRLAVASAQRHSATAGAKAGLLECSSAPISPVERRLAGQRPRRAEGGRCPGT